MTLEQAAELLALASAYDSRKPDRARVMAWNDALQGLDPDDCADAIRAHYRSSNEFVMPGHVRAIVIEMTNRRVEKRDSEERRAIEAQADPEGQKRVRELLNQLADKLSIPPEQSPHPKQEADYQRRARAVRCPWCSAQPGERCVNQGTQRPAVFVHDARQELAAQPTEVAG